MRIALYSDLHLELSGWKPPDCDVDAVILAGDIGGHTHGIAWAAKAFPRVPDVLYVAGNHEYYGAHLGLVSELRKPSWERLGVQFLERRTFELNGVRFLGCTLWSGFDLNGAGAPQQEALIAARGLSDYTAITARHGRLLEPADTLRLHRTAIAWLDAELGKPFDGKTVVITHFSPHRRCVAPQHAASDVSPYFVNDSAWLMEKHRIDVWCYGHTHTNISFIAENGCRVISNQRGYPTEPCDGFNPGLVIEV